MNHLDNSGQSKISHLNNIEFIDQDISGSKISVDVTLRFQISHARSHLTGKTDKIEEMQVGFLNCKDIKN